MFKWLGASQLVDLIAIGVAFAGGAWLISNSISGLGERLGDRISMVDVHITRLDAELKSFKTETSEYRKRNDERMDNLEERMNNIDERMNNLFGSVSRIEGHLFGSEPASVEESPST